MCKVSVIVPVYNVSKYLRECLNSLVNQTLEDIQIILVDDGSTDESFKICNYFKMLDKRIEVYHKKNEGQALARNYGLSKAKGEFVTFVDPDDYIDIDALKKLFDTCKLHNFDVCIGGFCYFFEDGRSYNKIEVSQATCFIGKSGSIQKTVG